MHAVMMTSQPSLFYWQPGTIAVMHAIHAWRRSGWSVYFSMDAGPNVHCFCEAAQVADVDQRLRKVPGVKAVLSSGPGAGAQLLEHHLF
jgi:diphosphomevalonate decarboxylase